MRILQLIDSLEAGGAERMAVNYANSLASRIGLSALVVTRKEGILKEHLHENVHYLFLGKTKTIDIKAVWKLKKFIASNDISIIHAHGTSFFTAILVKLFYPKVKIVWHDHNGRRVQEGYKKNKILIFSSYFFSAVIAVSHQLKDWSKENLFVKNVLYLANFAVQNFKEEKITLLKGEEGKRIVCLSNLRSPKNHLLLLKAFSQLQDWDGWTLHCVGNDYQDAYSSELKAFIKDNNLEDFVFLYGGCTDIYHILKQASVGILASLSEGFPVVLLEYGLSGLPVVSTNVGYCATVIEHEKTGLTFDPRSQQQLEKQLSRVIKDENLRTVMGNELYKSVTANYSEEPIIQKLQELYKEINGQ